MSRWLRLLPALVLVMGSAAAGRAQDAPADLVFVPGGTFKNPKSNYYGRVAPMPAFYLGKYEVTQKQWHDVMGSNPAKFPGADRPVETVSWYECIEYCNRRSEKEGLRPCYRIDRRTKDPSNENEIDEVKWTVTLEPGANGYRLPTEAEWEYAAGGGQRSHGYAYSGGDELDAVGWYYRNSGDAPLTGLWTWAAIAQNHNQTKPVGGKAPNELGLFDLSGNVREWCWDWFRETDDGGTVAPGTARHSLRTWRGGGWLGADFCCATSFRGGFEASGRGPDQGLRVCRSP